MFPKVRLSLHRVVVQCPQRPSHWFVSLLGDEAGVRNIELKWAFVRTPKKRLTVKCTQHSSKLLFHRQECNSPKGVHAEHWLASPELK
jgi:hypothetical protein